MSRPRLTDRQKQERALFAAVGRASGEMGLKMDCEIAALFGMGASTYSARKTNMFKRWGFEDASRLARTLHLTGEEVCRILGVPYKSQSENI